MGIAIRKSLTAEDAENCRRDRRELHCLPVALRGLSAISAAVCPLQLKIFLVIVDHSLDAIFEYNHVKVD
jgi:hypothetical protein